SVVQIKFQNKRFKMMARSLLGVSISLYFISGFVFVKGFEPRWLFILFVTILFFAVYKFMKNLRSRFSVSPCEACPLGYFPTCSWNLVNILDQNVELAPIL